MLFHTLEFALFLAAVWPAYLLLRRIDLQNALLVAASYLFYGWWEWRYLPLLLASTGVDYFIGMRLEGESNGRTRRNLVVASCVANLSLLGFFKYWDFFASTSNGVGAWLGMPDVLPELHILLPIGISFYTFQSMAYTIDVHRGQVAASRDFVQFAAYISFFPQLVAGPIERARNLLRAMTEPRRVDMAAVEEGAFLFAQGWLLKSIADILGGAVDPVFIEPATKNSWMLWWGIYGFSFQIYCDFLGYSQMARGVARLFGFRLMENFRAPFFAPNVRELWARWHISLTTWLRDYLYLSLGGGSRGQARQLANLFLTMLLAGLWHGAAGHYVVWGASFGVILVAHQLLFARRVGRRARRIGLRGFAMAVLGALVSFHAFALTMVLFRAQASGGRSALENAFDYFAGLLSVVNSAWQPPPVAMWVIVVVIFFDWLHLRCGTSEWARDWPWPVRGVVIGLLVSAAVIFGSPEAHTFIYFQF